MTLEYMIKYRERMEMTILRLYPCLIFFSSQVTKIGQLPELILSIKQIFLLVGKCNQG